MPEALDDNRIRSIVAAQIKGALGYDADQLSANRSDNIARYEGEPYGNERAGRSQVMSRDVMETVEAVMPSLVRTFLGTDEVVTFDPAQQDDEAYADQATDYVNHVLFRDNPGFRIATDWMKSALVTSTSVVKLWWDETDKTAVESYSGLSEDEFVQLVSDEGVEILEHTSYADVAGQRVDPEQAMMAQMQGAPVTATHDVKIRKTTTKKRLRWEAVPPEEFLINRRARTLDEDDNSFSFCCHRQARTLEELEAEGYDPDILARAPENDDWYLDETEERWDDLEYTDESLSDSDYSQRRVWVYECYIKIDADGDGIAELRKITVLGGASNTMILDDEEVFELPFAELCPIRLPYRFYGWSLADLSKDIQELKTAILRQMMDGLYQSVNPHKAVNINTANLDDLLTEAPGSIWGVDVPEGGNVQGHIVPMVTQWPGAQAFPMIEYIDRVLDSRTGVNDLAGGLDGGALAGETARGVEEAANSARSRVELIARTFAETGWTRLVRLALRMLNRHQDKARMIRLRGEWIEVDPRSWNTDMDVKINVGLGVGTKAEQFQKLMAIANEQKGVLTQMGPVGPLTDVSKFYNTLSKMAEAADQDPDAFWIDPTDWVEQQRNQPPQPPSPPPEVLKMQAEMQMKQQENQAKLAQAQAESQAKLQQSQAEAQMRADTDRQRAQMDAEIARFKAEMEIQQQREAAQLKAAVDREIAANKLALEREKMNAEHQYRMSELAAEQELEREKMRAGSPDGQGNIPRQE